MNEPIRIELPTIFGMKTVNSFLFKEPEPVLIDCGENTAESWDALTKGLNDNGLQLSDIKKIYVTHMHTDHVGMAGRISDEFGTEIWVNEKSVDSVINFTEYGKSTRRVSFEITSKLMGYDPKDPANPIMSSGKISDKTKNTWTSVHTDNLKVYNIGDKIKFGDQEWETIFMPGHSDTQTIFVQNESKRILSADMLLSVTPTPFYELTEGMKGERIKGLPIMMESYERLNNIDFSLAYPGHYDIINNPKEIIKKQVDHIHKRKMQVYELIKSGEDNYQKLYVKMYDRFTITAVTMLVGYLDLLVAENKISWIEDEKSIRFETIKNITENIMPA